MPQYTDDELESMLSDLESDLVERKRTPSDRSAMRRTICALANDLPNRGKAGAIFVGVNDDGGCANTAIDDDLLRTLAQMRGGRVNAQNIGQGVTDYRNPPIAEAMGHLGYAQSFGLGIPLAKESLAKNGNPPLLLELEPTGVLATVRPAP